jgi:hypothetical protein
VFLADEVWRWCSPQNIPVELATIAQMGRVEGLELCVATQLPHKIHASVTGQATEVVAFRLDETLALGRMREIGGDPEQIRALPLGQFVAWNRLSGGRLAGRVF